MGMLTGASNVEALTAGVSNFVEIASSMLTTVTGNPVLMVFFSAGLAFTAVSLVRRLKGN